MLNVVVQLVGSKDPRSRTRCCVCKSRLTVWQFFCFNVDFIEAPVLPAQTVEMHKEKVSRREIGVFTAVRRVPRSHKILPPQPASVQPRPPYSRRPICYQQLDGVGHGMKVTHLRKNFLLFFCFMLVVLKPANTEHPLQNCWFYRTK